MQTSAGIEFALAIGILGIVGMLGWLPPAVRGKGVGIIRSEFSAFFSSRPARSSFKSIMINVLQKHQVCRTASFIFLQGPAEAAIIGLC
ncbi:MAG TPA: hypothetical protein VMD30_06900 [Tepidisphaeraceae bacterium]|nr:hypothetical protein [Tepidisphaeraceae bacterium]